MQRSHAIANGVLRRAAEPGRPRAPAAATGSSSGAELCRRSVRRDRRQGRARTRRRSWSSMRPRPRRCAADPLAVPARPPHRRLRRPHRSDSSTSERPDNTSAQGLGYSHARRVGTAPRHLALLAAQGGVSWPGKFEPIPGVFAEMVRALVRWRGGAHQRRRRCDGGRACRALLWSGDVALDERRSSITTRPTTRGAAITGRSSCSARRPRVARRRSSTGATTPGAASIRPTISTTSIPTPGRALHSAFRSSIPASSWRAARIDVNGARHAAHHRGMPAQPQPQSRLSTAPRSSNISASSSA